MNNRHIIEAIKSEHNLSSSIPADELIVVGGAALQMFGYKQTTDIDVVVTPKQMKRMVDTCDSYQQWTAHKGKLEHQGLLLTVRHKAGQFLRGDYYGSTFGDITYMLAPNDHLYQATFEELRDEAANIGGVLVSPPERILAWKRAVNRPKDAADIALLEKRLLKGLMADG